MPPAAVPSANRLLLPAFGVVLAYVLIGLLGSVFAIPPGYASPFFPAAGVALIAVLVHGPRMAWAVLLGSLALQLALANQHGAAGWTGWVVLPALIAGGGGLQALAGALLVRRHLRTPLTLDSPRTIARFFCLAAVLASLISPTIGTLALWAGGALEGSELPLTWAVWWGGDALGVVVAAPVVLSLIGQPREAWRTRRSSVALPLLLATLLLALAVSQVVRWQEQRGQARFERDADNTSRTFELRLQAHLDALEAIHGVYIASDDVTREEFRLASAAWLAKLPGLQAVGWNERVALADVAAFEEGVRAEGLADYRVFEREDGLTAADDEVIALRHIEPRAGNEAALGVNSLSVPAAREAISQALRSNEAVATAGFRLTQESGKQQDVVIYRAVRRSDVSGQPAPAEPLGLVFVTLRMEDALQKLLAGTPEYLRVCLFETVVDGSSKRLAGTDCAPDQRSGAALLHRTEMPFAGRQWELQVHAHDAVPSESAGPLASETASTWMFVLAGLTATGLMGALLLIVTGRTRRTEAAVAERTVQLQHEIAEREATEQALRDSERRFRNIFNSVPLGVIYTDLSGGIKQPNASFAAMTGYSEEELLDTTTPALTHPDDLAEDQRLRDALARGEQQLVRRRKRLITRDGRVLWVDATMTLQQDARGGPQRLVALIEDISEHLRLEEAERARETAEASNHAKSEFLSRMSHELRTPLNAMLGFAQLLELDAEPRLNDRHAQWVAQIRRAGWHLLEMINDVLDLSRIESGTLKLEQRALRMEPLLVESMALVEAQTRERDVRLVRGPSEEPGVRVLGDATRIKQILTNLLSNAIKYNRPGGEVVLTTRRRSAEDGTAMLDIEVCDTGLGMSPEQLAQLFQPFNRLGRERGGAEGTGIGLVITRLLAERLGGSLSVRSTEGVGSVFTLSLPLAGHCAASTEPAVLDDAGGGYHRRHVLYIEDNEVNVEVMRGIFAQRPQVRLDIATTGLDGLAMVRTAPPDLILLDMHLPDIDGMALLQHLQSDESTAGIPVIVVSADALPAQRDAALQAGASRYVTKPVSVEDMLAVLDEELSQLITRFG